MLYTPLLPSTDSPRGSERKKSMVRVVFLTAILPQYRLPFHTGVRARLSELGIQYDVIFGQPDAAIAAKADTEVLSWGKQVANRHFKVGRFSAVWQPALKDIWACDLAVIGQESRLLVNYMVQGLRGFRRPKVALWGHGRNFQADPGGGFAERWKRVWATHADWWFAYTEATRKIVEGYGFPSDRITVVHNTIDTSEIRRLGEQLTASRLDALRRRLDIKTNNVGVYVGGLYDHKRIDFLIDSAKEIRRQIPDFTLIVVGSGVDRHLIEAAASQYSWVRYLGPLFGVEKVEILRLGRVFMMPGLVGLAILDCSAAGLPIVTTAYPYHSPEIAYLETGRNGLMIEDWQNPVAYARGVMSVLLDDALHARLASAANEIASGYTMERMVHCFSEGIFAALSAPKIGRWGLRL
jgi:glycosyltransferase involved in cell wall biosynthesis